MHYANCADYEIEQLIGSRTITGDGKVEWRDGIVMQAIRNGGVLMLDEYNFMRGEVRGRLHEVLDSILRDTGEIQLTENFGEKVKVHTDFRLIAAQNEPGGDTSDREVLDAAQVTRFVYLKEVDRLPDDVRLSRLLGSIGKDNVITVSPEDTLTMGKGTPLGAIPGIEDLLTRYAEFSNSVESLVRNRELGKKQSQPVYFSPRDDKRVKEFIERFYNGDPNGTMQQALRYYFKERFSSAEDRQAVEELILHVETDLSAAPTSKRQGLEEEGAATASSPSLAAVAKVMGKNFLGPEEWKRGFGVDVGGVPPIPSSITKALLESDCPLHPGEKIKDTHLLVLIPKTVNGEAYTALKLDELCATRKGSGEMLIDDRFDSWKAHRWASTPQTQSEWVLIPKSDPVRGEVSEDKHFRYKTIAQQAEVHREHYGDYREAKTLEVMTAALLNDMVNGEPRMLDGFNYLRCEEPNASGGRVCVGFFRADGLRVLDGFDVVDNVFIGRALARKLKT